MSTEPRRGAQGPDDGIEPADPQIEATRADRSGDGNGAGETAGGAGRWRIALIGLLVALLAAGVWFLTREGSQGTDVTPPVVASTSAAPVSTAAPPPATTTVPSAPPTSAAPPARSTAPAPTPTPAGKDGTGSCQPMGDGFVPTRFELERPRAKEQVLALGEASDGTIAAPPKNQPRTASWWMNGPKPGSAEGKVVLSIHTYRNGGALGNEMYRAGRSRISPGDIIKLTNRDGKVACYKFVKAEKVWVKDYDPNSTVMIDHAGDPKLIIVICWDREGNSDFWASRIFFTFEPVNA